MSSFFPCKFHTIFCRCITTEENFLCGIILREIKTWGEGLVSDQCNGSICDWFLKIGGDYFSSPIPHRYVSVRLSDIPISWLISYWWSLISLMICQEMRGPRFELSDVFFSPGFISFGFPLSFSLNNIDIHIIMSKKSGKIKLKMWGCRRGGGCQEVSSSNWNAGHRWSTNQTTFSLWHIDSKRLVLHCWSVKN